MANLTSAALREWLTPQEVADELRLPVKTLYDWRHRKIGPVATRFGRHLRYDRQVVDDWINALITEQSDGG